MAALTRARGKMLSVANADYMRTKNLSRNLMFRQKINETENCAVSRGAAVFSDCASPVMPVGTGSVFDRRFLDEVSQARGEARIDIPGMAIESVLCFQDLAKILSALKQRGRKVAVRAESKAILPAALRPMAIENRYFANPITMIDRRVVWFGCPIPAQALSPKGCPFQPDSDL